MDWQAKNTEVYNASAKALAAYFAGIGARIDDIDRGIQLAGNPRNCRAFEIGCGDGRDAAEIASRVAWYEGIDTSEGLLEIARQHLPNERFILADARSYEFPKDLNIIFAFASLLHIQRDDLPAIFEKAAHALRAGGVFYISTKERSTYAEEVKADTFGQRMFYYYNVDTLTDMAGAAFTLVHEHHQKIGHTEWMEIALQKAGSV